MSIAILTISITFLGFLLGSALASGVFCFAMRNKRGEKWTGTKNRSHCDSCNHILSPLDLIPVFSFAFLRGKCKYCGAKIPNGCFKIELLWGCFGALITYSAISLAEIPIIVAEACIGTVLGCGYIRSVLDSPQNGDTAAVKKGIQNQGQHK